STARRSTSCSRRQCSSGGELLEELAREGGTLARVLVLEEDERALPGLGEDRRRPPGEVVVAVLGAAQAQVAPARRRDDGGLRLALLVGVGRAERRALRAKDVVYVVPRPRIVAELERGGTVRRQALQERLEPGHVLLEVRRELEERRAQAIAERAGL